MDEGEIRWVDCDGVNVAYQVTGRGPETIMFLDFWLSHLDHDWAWAPNARALRRIASVARMIRFDRSGMGLSDRVVPPPSEAMEMWAKQALAVIDAAGCEQVHLMVSGWCGQVALTLAALAPERIGRIHLHHPFARLIATDEYPFGFDAEFAQEARAAVVDGWGTGVLIELLGIEVDDRTRSHQAGYERCAAGRGDVPALAEALIEADVCDLLPAVTAPTLVTVRENPLVSSEHCQYVVERLPNAQRREIDPGTWSWPVADDDIPRYLLVGLEFLLGATVEADTRRRLLTMIFLDIVGSTPLVDRLGDREWSDVLDDFRSLLVDGLEEWQGRMINSAGDGFLLVFDSPYGATQFARALRPRAADLGLRVRTGIHVGECELVDDDLRGLAVHAAARIMALADADQILVSEVVRMLLPEGVETTSVGEHELRGVPGQWELHRILA